MQIAKGTFNAANEKCEFVRRNMKKWKIFHNINNVLYANRSTSKISKVSKAAFH